MKHFIGCFLVLLSTTAASAQDIFNRAKSALAAKDTALAIATFQEALRAGQKSAESNYYLGAIAYARNKIDDAIRYLTTSVQADDDNLAAVRLTGDAHMAKGDPQKALVYYRQAAKLAPQDPMVAAGYGTALLQADSVDAAIVRLSSAIVLNPNNPALYVALGDAYMKQNVIALGVANYQKAIELDPGNIATRFKLAGAFEKDRKWTDAVKEYRQVQAIDSMNAEAYFQEGNIWFKATRYKEAVVPLRKYLRLRPSSFEGASKLAQSLLEAKDPEAAAVAHQALNLDSSKAETWRTYFYALVDNKDFNGAKNALRGLQVRGGLVADDYLKLGSLYYGLGQEEEALSWYLKAITTDTTNCEPYFNVGTLYMKKQDYANAAKMFEKKIECDPRSLSAILNAGICYLTLKDYGNARDRLNKVVELKPDYYQGRLWLARYFAQVDSLDKAVEQYNEVLHQVEGQPDKKNVAGEAYFSIGATYFGRQQFEKAIEACRKALALGYENNGLQLMLGQAILQTLDPRGNAEENQRKVEEARKAFSRCVSLNPNNADGHLWLGEALVRSRIEGETERNRQLAEEACAEFKKALRLDPRNDQAKKAMERIGCQ
jgi:tetratricopeptide (TPR) repeat protein